VGYINCYNLASKMDGKRTFKDIRELILISLSSGSQTINQISYQTKINWKTVDLHLIYLFGKGFVKKVLSTQYVRIYALSDLGKEYVRSIGIEPVEEDIHNNHNNHNNIREIKL